MDRLSIVMVRSSLIWLLAGVVIGSLMLVDRAIPGDWRLWMAPSHGHMLFVGWLVQFALGIAYWLMPRKRSPERPLGYHEGLAISGSVALNVGLALRVIAEPLERTGHGDPATLALLIGSAALQFAAIAVFVGQLWPRIYGRSKLGRSTASGG
ncbi:MAG: cbb3-type cytochrome c oxidase subunit I [Chloroflexota bacterium]|nr:cbb3-type cytochrome c oxidase subunit I [Chloroflexota bacterium]